ncbi:hypothetical protein JCGZ_18127 [Jatropha curcas]|uniref:Aminotransferase-like plant mobile domain-containing protein n=1 Tax=Jatropha curcas TaxID=180498 RepID=A0A067K1W4_JATCU|nr:hypothetical protein JCGZ_18127 [Jatropha curcas]
MEVALDPTLGLGPAIAILADLRQAPPQLQLDPEHATHISRKINLLGQRYLPRGLLLNAFLRLQVPAQRYQELYQRFCFARSYIARLYPELHERLIMYFNPNTMVFRFEDSEVTLTSEEMCAVMGHHPEQSETPALPPGPRYDLTEVSALCPVYLLDGIDPNQGLPLEPFLTRVLSMDANPSWVRACCFLLLNMYAMKNRQPGVGDFRLLTIVRDMQVYCRTVFMMIMGETMCWIWDIALHVTNFDVHLRGCPMLLQAWALDKLSLIPPVPAPGSMNLSYVLYASLDRSIAYFPDRINRQYGVVQRVRRIHDFESGPMTQSLLTNLADRWRN